MAQHLPQDRTTDVLLDLAPFWYTNIRSNRTTIDEPRKTNR